MVTNQQLKEELDEWVKELQNEIAVAYKIVPVVAEHTNILEAHHESIVDLDHRLKALQMDMDSLKLATIISLKGQNQLVDKLLELKKKEKSETI